MFVGHYGVSFVVKAKDHTIPLWVLFIAVQLVDVFWAIFVVLGIEKVRIVPGFTATNPLDLYYMPYTHSLVATLVWLAVGLAAYKWLGSRRATGAALFVGIAVASHWFLDLIVHVPDLPLYDDAYKLGFGLWNLPALAFLLEGVLLFGGMALYLRATAAKTPAGSYAMVIFGVVLLAIQASVLFMKPPPSPQVAASTALIPYFLFAAVAYWLEQKRVSGSEK